MNVKVGDEIDTYEISKEKELVNLAKLMRYEAISKEERAMCVYRHLFKMRKIKRKENKDGKFSTVWKVVKIKSVDDYLTEELGRHGLDVVDYVGLSKCGEHAPRITQCKETGRIYDEFNCLTFKDEKEWRMYESGNRNVGDVMECLRRYNMKNSTLLEIQSIREKVERSEIGRKSVYFKMNEPPDGG